METKLKCIIIDDEPLARELIRSYVERTPGLTLAGEYETAADALDPIMQMRPDILFLDINMPRVNGIDFAAMIPADTRILYITAYDRYAVQGFRVNALDYLLKPVSYEDFLRSVGKAFEWKRMKNSLESQTHKSSGSITIKSENRLIQMRLDTIRYIEVRNDRVIFFRTDGSEITSLMSMKEIEDMLPSDIFMRVHRSFMVNMDTVEVVERNRIVYGKTYIPISENKRDEFFERFK